MFSSSLSKTFSSLTLGGEGFYPTLAIMHSNFPTAEGNMNIQKAFSLNAAAYEQVNIIQKRVVDELLSHVDDTPECMLDIGCGSGGVYRALGWSPACFVGMDFADGMLARHPQADNVTLLKRDFNTQDAFKDLDAFAFERIISASALQWADDLDGVLANIAALKAPVSLAIFTANTFKTLYQTASLPPLLRSKEETVRLLEKHFQGNIEVLEYTLTFSSVREMFRYMKQSGVGAGRNVLGYKAMKQLMQTYPLEYLEYEIVLLHEKQPR